MGVVIGLKNGDEMGLIGVPDLHQVAIGLAVEKLEHVRTRRQDLAGNFDGLTESDDCHFVPVVGFNGCAEDGAEGCSAKPKLKCSNDTHITILLIGISRASKVANLTPAGGPRSCVLARPRDCYESLLFTSLQMGCFGAGHSYLVAGALE